MEMLVVLSLIIIIGGIGISSFLGLNASVKMNEYTMNLEQDIRRMQRASMLLERSTAENWLYGIGIDFSDMENDGNYVPFKWCTSFSDYGDISTTSRVPAYEPGKGLDSAKFPVGSVIDGNFCNPNNIPLGNKTNLRILPGYQRSLTLPIADITLGRTLEEGEEQVKLPQIVVFESVSGRAFFYDEEGNLLNYKLEDDQLVMKDSAELEDLIITIEPVARGVSRQITIKHLSGRVVTGRGDN